MAHTVFFSWQADTDTKTGRNLVERALRLAVGKLGSDAELEEVLRDLAVDKDTEGIPGSPPIVDTIFKKIDAAAIFVPDLTFVGTRRDGRPTPNPNVLIEYGWALKALKHERVVPVMNVAYGRPTPEAMPFDMRHLRNPICYECPDDADEGVRARIKAELARSLERALRAVLESEAFRASLPRPPAAASFQPRLSLEVPVWFQTHERVLGLSDRSQEEIHLLTGAATWLRLMPSIDPGKRWTNRNIQEAIAGENRFPMPLGAGVGGYGQFRAEDGIGVWGSDGSGGRSTSLAVIIFHTGEVWTVDSRRLDATRGNGQGAFSLNEWAFKKALADYSEILKELGVAPPYRWVAGMEGLKGRSLRVPSRVPGGIASFDESRSVSDRVVEEGTHTPGIDPGISLRPFFEKVYDCCGVTRPAWLDGLATSTRGST